MVKINNNITEESFFLYDADDNLVGEIKNELAYYDVCLQIKEQKLEGHSLEFRGNRYYINSDGHVHYWPTEPKGMFTALQEKKAKLFNW